MADDIEEFLRRVAEKRRGQQGGRSPSNQPRPQQPPQRPPQQRQTPPQVRPVAPPPVIQRQSLSDIPEAEAAGTAIHEISTNEVQKHAQQYMSRAEFEERSKQVGMHAKPLSHLESSVAKAHTARAEEIKSGGIQDAAAFPNVPAAQAESPLTALFKSREAFRSAYLLTLILDKPAWKDD